MNKKYTLVLFQILFVYTSVHAKVIPNSLFSSNMVLQQGVIVPVWGKANEGENIDLYFNGQHLTTVTKNGKWIVYLTPMKATTVPLKMIIVGENNIEINNVLIGEVWLCSGQSNMAFPIFAVKPIGDAEKLSNVINSAQHLPLLRQFSIPLRKSESIPEKIEDVDGRWLVCDSNNVKSFSAVAFFYARALFDKLKVPIGFINSSYGGTAIENWISKETLLEYPAALSIFKNYSKAINEFPQKLEKYKNEEPALIEKFMIDSIQAKVSNSEIPKKPTPPMSPAERGGPNGLYNTMIYPLLPYSIKGVIWYQGEANASRGVQYRELLPALIKEWRADWNNKDLPFFYVQIPGWKNHYPELKEAQMLTLQKVKNTAMTVIYDVDDTLDVHPGNKQPVGQRLSLAARALVYGEESLEYMGPIYKSMEIDYESIIISFDHVKAFSIKGNEVKDFFIAGADKQFYPATVKVVKNKLIVFCDKVKKPIAVRAGWRFCPQLNIYNEADLPISPFRTDIE